VGTADTPQVSPGGYQDAQGKAISPDAAAQILCDRLKQPDALRTGVNMRFQENILRFRPTAEQRLEQAYAWVSRHRDQWVGINMVGREDNDKGYALMVPVAEAAIARALP